jgi:hypothetical protein
MKKKKNSLTIHVSLAAHRVVFSHFTFILSSSFLADQKGQTAGRAVT